MTQRFATVSIDDRPARRVPFNDAARDLGSALLFGDLVDRREERRPNGDLVAVVEVKTEHGTTRYELIR